VRPAGWWPWGDGKRALDGASTRLSDWRSVTLFLLVLAAMGFTGGGWLLGSSWERRRRRRPLVERLAPFAPTPLADQVEGWLERRGDDAP
jgi:hypothetical protein